MKYYFLMPLKSVICLCALLIVSEVSFSQTLSQSPYGKYANGDQLPITNSLQQGLGGIYTTFSDSNSINLSQPASLTSLGSGVTVFEVGFMGLATEFKTSQLQRSGRTAGFGYLALAFPIIKKKWNASISLTPLSNSGYTLKDSINSGGPEGRIFIDYLGTGGFSSANLSQGVQISKDIAVGVQLRYIFGKSDDVTQVYFPDNGGIYRASKYTSSKRISDVDLTFGLTLQHRFKRPVAKIDTIRDSKYPLGYRLQITQKDSIHLKFGGTFIPAMSANASNSFLAESFFTSGATASRDTVKLIDNEGGSIRMPMQAAAGFMISNCYNRWLFSAELRYTDWNGFRVFDRVDSVSSSYRAAAGFQWIPKPMDKGPYLTKIRYRLGGYYSDGYLKLNNAKVPEMGVSIGFGLPIEVPTYSRKPATSLINISVTAGKRGVASSNLLVERFISVGVGFSLNDRWFNRSRFE